jgi:MoaA/NifB/PqqE/SkfB family radical SAM enzyme
MVVLKWARGALKLKLGFSSLSKNSIDAHLETFLKEITPKLFLFPVTLRCNSQCVMCNIWRLNQPSELSLAEIDCMLKDAAFKKIEHVIVTGGEPTLRSDLSSVVDLLISNCSSLRSVQVATNGFNTEKVVDDCTNIAKACLNAGITFSILVSLDGVKGVHEKVRRVPDAFDKVEKTIDALLTLQPELKFGLHANCVLTKYNIYEISNLINWCSQRGIYLEYQLAHDWQRFRNSDDDFSLNKAEMDFYLNLLWNKINSSRGGFYDWIVYRIISQGCDRPAGCPNLINAFSIYPDGSVHYCPNAESIGNIHNKSFSDIYYDPKNLKYRKKILASKKCKKCIQSCWNDNFFDNNSLNKIRYKSIRRLMVKTNQ